MLHQVLDDDLNEGNKLENVFCVLIEKLCPFILNGTKICKRAKNYHRDRFKFEPYPKFPGWPTR